MDHIDEFITPDFIDHVVIRDTETGEEILNRRGHSPAADPSAVLGIRAKGMVEIRDAETGEIVLSTTNDIHPENISHALALALANKSGGSIYEMAFGNGASTVSGTGATTYFPANVEGFDAQLYNQTFSKVVDDEVLANPDPSKNRMVVAHVQNQKYTDIIVSCTLEFGEPSGQEAFDDTLDNEGDFVFDEMGLKSYDPDLGTGRLLTHVIFHPVQKALNRSFEIKYTIRILMV